MTWRMLVGVLVTPMKTLERISEERPILPAAQVILVASLSWSLGVKLAEQYGAGKVARFLCDFSALHALVFGVVYKMNYFFVILLAAFAGIGFWFLRVAVLQLSAEVLGGMGRGFSLLAAFGYAHTPLLLTLPVALVALLCGGGNLDSGAGAVVWYGLAISVHLWTVYLVIVSIQATHKMKLPDAIRVIAYPVLALIATLLFFKLLVFLSGDTLDQLVRV
ncbi:MAG: YIP1 family protein [Armatimonadetes bacterium]|nr:YIP1 family protein [Armatimonadota bacterium]